jgi:hypothetical protein
VGRLELVVEASDVVEQIDGQVEPDLLRWGGRCERGEEPVDVRSVDFLGDPAWVELEQQGVQAAHDAAAVIADVGVALGQDTQHLAVTNRSDLTQPVGAQRGDRDRQRVVRVGLR